MSEQPFTPQDYRAYADSLGNVAEDESCMLAASARERLIDLLNAAADSLDRAMIPQPETVQTLVKKWRELGMNGERLIGEKTTLDMCADELESVLSQLPQRGWRSIDSAPKDGTQILVIVAGGKRIVASWNAQFDDWQEDALSYAFVPLEPLLWHPLPELPSPPADTEPT